MGKIKMNHTIWQNVLMYAIIRKRNDLLWFYDIMARFEVKNLYALVHVYGGPVIYVNQCVHFWLIIHPTIQLCTGAHTIH